jgi:hypothetical protein
MPERANNALMIWAPKSAAGTFAIEPLNLPTAVRIAAVMTTSFICPPDEPARSEALPLSTFCF